MVYYYALGAGLIVVSVFLFSRSKGASLKNLFLKMISSLFFILTAVLATMINPEASVYGILLVMGGALGLCGDITLDLKYIYKDDSHPHLVSGFLFFLVGHIFYSSAVIMYGKLELMQVLIAALISAAVGAGAILMGKPMKLDYGRYKFISFLYAAFLTMTAVVSIWSAVLTQHKSMIIMAAGSVLFLLSDLVLSNTYFGKGWDKPVHIFLNHLLYYAGQYLIASSAMFLN